MVLTISHAEAAPPPLHWQRGAHPLIVTVYDQTTDARWGAALHKLTDEWNVGTNGVEFVFSPDLADCENGHGPYTVVVCVHENRSENHVGEAALYSDGAGHLSQVLIWMDPRPDPAYNHLACHELGHALGVQHREAKARTCMTDGYVKRHPHPDQQDFDGVSSVYSHTH